MKIRKCFLGLGVGILAGCAPPPGQHDDGIRDVEYTIVMRSPHGHGASAPFTLVTAGIGGSQSRELAGVGDSHTIAFQWTDHDAIRRPDQPWFCGPAQGISVTLSKPGFTTWIEHYNVPGDFVRCGDGVYRRIDQITLHPQPDAITDELLQLLDESLPYALDQYSGRVFQEFDGNDVPEVYLYRCRSGSLRTSYNPVEFRFCSFRSREWASLLVANRQGIFISGRRVAGTNPAPYGYKQPTGFPPRNMQIAVLDATGLVIPDQVRTFRWAQGEGTFIPQ